MRDFFVGSSRVTTLNRRSMFKGHCALISFAVAEISDPLRGQSGWTSNCFVDTVCGAYSWDCVAMISFNHEQILIEERKSC